MLKGITKILVFTLCSLLMSTAVLSQKTIVKGKVIDQSNQLAVPFAPVFFIGTKTGTTTDLDGNFSFETYYSSDTLACLMVGYNPFKVKIQQGKSQNITLALVPNTQMTDLVI